MSHTNVLHNLQVDGIDLRDATHEKAVEVIRKSTTSVRFLVQSLVVDPTWVGALPIYCLKFRVGEKVSCCEKFGVNWRMFFPRSNGNSCSEKNVLRGFGRANANSVIDKRLGKPDLTNHRFLLSDCQRCD